MLQAQTISSNYDGREPEFVEDNYDCALSVCHVRHNAAWPRFSHARGDAGEGQYSAFEESMSESKMPYYGLGNPNTRCIEVVKWSLTSRLQNLIVYGKSGN